MATKEAQIPTIFQKDSNFNGLLKFKSPLTIKGSFFGDIEGEGLLLLDAQAQVKASLRVRHLILEGRLQGNVIATEKVELRSGAVLIGNIKTPVLEIGEGVIFEGQCEMPKEISGAGTLADTK